MERPEDTPSTRDLAGAGAERRADDRGATAEEPQLEQREDAASEADGSGAREGAVVEPRREGDGAVATDATTAAASPGTADVPDDDRESRGDAGESRGNGAGAAAAAEEGSLLPEGEESDLQRRWEEIQTRFVDDPRRAVQDADELVAGVMQRLAQGFAHAREGLEGQWSRGEDVGTEELRVALQRYRSFFRRLLSA
jgi:hypothetical protein